MSLATICRSVWIRAGIGPSIPGVWAGNADITATEIVEFAGEGLRKVAEDHDWQSLLRTHTASITTASEQSVTLPSTFGRLVPRTVWIAGEAQPVRGPVMEDEYETLRQDVAPSANPVFRIAQGQLNLLGATQGGTLTFRHVTRHVVQVAGGTGQTGWIADTDTARVDERLVMLATLAFWRDAKGLNPEVPAVQYREALARAKAADRPAGVMDLAGRRGGLDRAARDPVIVSDAGVLG